MRFRMTYQGLLLSETNKGTITNARATHKHEIRKHFHKQMKRLWEITPALANAGQENQPGKIIFGSIRHRNSIDGLAQRFDRFGYNFVPLITHDLDVVCSIDVLYLRSGEPGSVFKSGDVDNRLKTLFDALTMPQDAKQVGNYSSPDQDEIPFFCLLEDDSLITRASVETDTLLSPVSAPFNNNDARVIITIETKLTRIRGGNIAFG